MSRRHLSTREQPRPTRAQGRWATPLHYSSGHEVPGDGELGPLFPYRVERQFLTSPNPETNQGPGISGKAHPGYRVIQGHVHRSCKENQQYFKNCGERGKETEHGPSFHPRELSSALPARTPLHPRVPKWRTEGAMEVGGGGPAESPPTCGHRGAAPEQQQPRAAPHGREEPGGAGPGGCGREREPSWLWDEAPTVLGRNRVSLFLPPPGAPGSVSERRWRGDAGRGRAGRWGDSRAPAWRGRGTSGAEGALGP